MSVNRVNNLLDDNQFSVDRTPFKAVREYLKNGRRGHWVLYMSTALGDIIVDKDQYSNDLLERVDIHVNGSYSLNPGHFYGHRFKLNMSKGEFFEKSETILADAAFHFGGEWKAEYYDWDGQGAFCRVGGRLPEAKRVEQ